MKRQFILGIDLAKDSFVATLLDPKGTIIWQARSFENKAQGFLKLLKSLPKPKETLIILESTGVYGKRCIQYLCEKSLAVCEMNPMIIKRLSTSMVQTKTDQADATQIATIGRRLAKTEPKMLEKYRVKLDPDRDNLALWVSEYRRLSQVIAKLKQQTKGLAFHTASQATIILEQRMLELRQLQLRLQATKEALTKLLKQQAAQAAECLLSIPGVGPLTAATALVSIQNIQRFESADSLKAYWGIYPRRRQSGKHEARSRMANHGNKTMRHMLWNAAKSAARHNPICCELFERLIAKGKSAPAAYGAVARKLVQIIYGVLKSQTLFNPEINNA